MLCLGPQAISNVNQPTHSIETHLPKAMSTHSFFRQNRTLWGPHFYSVSRNLGFLKITLCSSFRFDLFYHGPSKSFLAKKIGCDRSSDLDITVDAVIFPYAMGLSVRGGVEQKKKIFFFFARPPPLRPPTPQIKFKVIRKISQTNSFKSESLQRRAIESIATIKVSTTPS